MRAVDTNVVVRLLTRDDERQAKAAEAYIAHDGGWVSHLVLVEVAWVLASVYALTPSEVAKAVELLLSTDGLVVEAPDVVNAALTLFRKGRGRDFADCMILEVARQARHLPLGTFDRSLARAEGAEAIRA